MLCVTKSVRIAIKIDYNHLADFWKAGTMRYAELRPQLAASLFPPQKPRTESGPAAPKPPRMIISRRRSRNEGSTGTDGVDVYDEFEDGVLDDGELMAASTKSAVLSAFFHKPAVLNMLHSG